MKVNICLMGIDKKFRLVRFGNGLTDKGSEELAFTITCRNLEFVGEKAAFKRRNIKFHGYCPVGDKTLMKTLGHKA